MEWGIPLLRRGDLLRILRLHPLVVVDVVEECTPHRGEEEVEGDGGAEEEGVDPLDTVLECGLKEGNRRMLS